MCQIFVHVPIAGSLHTLIVHAWLVDIIKGVGLFKSKLKVRFSRIEVNFDDHRFRCNGGRSCSSRGCEGAIESINSQTDFDVVLVGAESSIRTELKRLKIAKILPVLPLFMQVKPLGCGNRLQRPSNKKKDSSIHVGLQMVRGACSGVCVGR